MASATQNNCAVVHCATRYDTKQRPGLPIALLRKLPVHHVALPELIAPLALNNASHVDDAGVLQPQPKPDDTVFVGEVTV